MPRSEKISLFVLLIIGDTYCFWGLEMAYWVSALPGTSEQHAKSNFWFWIVALSTSCVLTVVLGGKLFRPRR